MRDGISRYKQIYSKKTLCLVFTLLANVKAPFPIHWRWRPWYVGSLGQVNLEIQSGLDIAGRSTDFGFWLFCPKSSKLISTDMNISIDNRWSMSTDLLTFKNRLCLWIRTVPRSMFVYIRLQHPKHSPENTPCKNIHFSLFLDFEGISIKHE